MASRERGAEKPGWLVRLGLKPAGGYVRLLARPGEVDQGEAVQPTVPVPIAPLPNEAAPAAEPVDDPEEMVEAAEPPANPETPRSPTPLADRVGIETSSRRGASGLRIPEELRASRVLVLKRSLAAFTPARTVEAGWLTAMVVVPLIYWAAGRDSYELPKQIALRSILYVALALAIAVALVRWAAWPGPLPGRRMLASGAHALLRWPPFWAALAVNGAWSVATIASVAPLMSFWGTTNRWSGLRTEWTYGALFLLGAALLTRRVQLTRLAGALAIGGAPIALYALYQKFGPQHPWIISSGTPAGAARPFGTLGNPIFLADLALLAFFLILGALLGSRRWLARGLWAAALAFQVVSLVLPQSRAAWLALLVGLGVLAMLLAALHGVSRRHWLLGPALAGLVLVGALWAGQAPLRGVGLGRLADLVNPTEYAAQSRLLQWKAAGLAWLRRPLLGFGPETFESVIERDWDAALQRLGVGDDLVYDRAHNAALDALVSAGALGGAGLLLLGGLLAVHVRRLHAHYRDEREAALALGLGAPAGAAVLRTALVPLCAVAGLVAYLTAQQFGIQTVASSSIAWLLAGGLMGLARATMAAAAFDEAPAATTPEALTEQREAAAQGPGRWMAAAGGATVAILAVAVAIPFELRPLWARLHDDAGVALHRAQRLEDAVKQEEVAVGLWPHNFRHWSELAYALRAAARPKPDPDSHAEYRRAVVAAQRALAINPVYPRVKAYFGDVAGEAAVRTGDAVLAERALAAHAEATTEAPLSWRYREMSAQTYFQMRKFDAAKGQLSRAVELWPTNWTLWAALGDAGVLSSDRETGKRAYEQALRLNPTHEGIQRALAALG